MRPTVLATWDFAGLGGLEGYIRAARGIALWLALPWHLNFSARGTCSGSLAKRRRVSPTQDVGLTAKVRTENVQSQPLVRNNARQPRNRPRALHLHETTAFSGARRARGGAGRGEKQRTFPERWQSGETRLRGNRAGTSHKRPLIPPVNSGLSDADHAVCSREQCRPLVSAPCNRRGIEPMSLPTLPQMTHDAEFARSTAESMFSKSYTAGR